MPLAFSTSWKKLLEKIKSKKLNNRVVLLFKDNGLGIDPQTRGGKIFGLYKRFHTDRAEGKGIGLYMVKTQVEQLAEKSAPPVKQIREQNLKLNSRPKNHKI